MRTQKLTSDSDPAAGQTGVRKQARAEEGKKTVKRRRMAAVDREELILREATVYFAEYGLDAGTIKLAQRIGITQPLLYKYFPTKDALVEQVYARLIPKSWNPSWELLLVDDSLPIRDRLYAFYVEYATSVLTYEHVRLFLFSGLGKNDFNTRYYGALTKRIFERIARALRTEYGQSRKSRVVTKSELELVQSLHAAIYQVAFRKWVHQDLQNDDLSALVKLKIDFFLDGAEQSLRRMHSRRKKRPG